MSRSGRGTKIGVIALAALTAVTAASAASSLSYRGKTSQHRAISFTVSGGAVRKLSFTIVDSCPRRHILYVRNSGFPAMPIRNHKFGGKFNAKPPAVAQVTVSGTVSGKTVKGTLHDRSKNRRTRKFCSGTATFKLRPR